ncbi:SDR family NAD(P)-dependent oxidoreductase [Streptomyces luteoverticillatus]|uniref:SDR family NAD(P)-dependent oxidoreductase n=1 Tax=Streptomyces luteoverticillatus TaxID=66425 RepID=UPI003D3643FA
MCAGCGRARGPRSGPCWPPAAGPSSTAPRWRGTSAIPQSPLYSATKHAVIGLSKSAALQYAGDGIRVNVVSPGSTDTPLLRDLYRDPDALDQRARRASLGRLGSCEEVANAAAWLLSPLSGYATGQTIVVDGGVTAGSAVTRR